MSKNKITNIIKVSNVSHGFHDTATNLDKLFSTYPFRLMQIEPWQLYVTLIALV